MNKHNGALYDYVLKASRIKTLLHGVLFMVMAGLWLFQLTVWGLTLLSILAVMSYWFYAMQAQAWRVAQLDADVWTVEWSKPRLLGWDWIDRARSTRMVQHCADSDRYTKPKQTFVKHQQLEQVLDHALYVVLRFQKAPAVIIWRDQVLSSQWKQLKILAKLH